MKTAFHHAVSKMKLPWESSNPVSLTLLLLGSICGLFTTSYTYQNIKTVELVLRLWLSIAVSTEHQTGFPVLFIEFIELIPYSSC